MARGRHARRSGPFGWLRRRRSAAPGWRDVHAQALLAVTGDVRALEQEVVRLRSVEQLTTAAAVDAELRAARLERELTVVRGQVACLQDELAGLREELVWAFAEGKVRAEAAGQAPRVIDLTKPVASTA